MRERKDDRESTVPEAVKTDGENTSKWRKVTLESMHEALRTRPTAHWSHHVADRVVALFLCGMFGLYMHEGKLAMGTGIPLVIGLYLGHEALLRMFLKRFGG